MNADYCAYPPHVAADVEITEDRDGDRLAYIVGAATVGRYLLLRATEYNVLGLLSQSLAPGEICDEFKRRYGATLSLPTLKMFLAKLDDVGILAGERAGRSEAWGQQLSSNPYFRVKLFNPDRLFARIVIERGHLRVVRAKGWFHDFKRAPVEPLGLGELAGVFVEDGQVVEDARHFQMVWTEGGLRQRERLLVKWLSLPVLARGAADLGCVAQ